MEATRESRRGVGKDPGGPVGDETGGRVGFPEGRNFSEDLGRGRRSMDGQEERVGSRSFPEGRIDTLFWYA